MASRHPRERMNAQQPSRGSLTQTSTDGTSEGLPLPRTGRLRLRAEEVPEVDSRTASAHDTDGGAESSSGARPRIRWAEDVVDNEGLGRKSSKVCCIYHPTRAVGESSSEDDSSDSSSSDSDSDSDVDDGAARRAASSRRRGHDCDDHDHSHDHGTKGKGKKKPSPNAYERMPKVKLPTGGPVGGVP